ncbi:MAG: chromosome segregation protein SMC [Hyphomicrobiaceae bacterium]
MKLTRLRLVGFKSFVEPTDLVILDGLTGVVGPNGCGKSNLLEALRWSMGETSHKSMRAASMDDVIFNGTTSRPPRNWAEVTLFLDNSARRAPTEFNNDDTLEITRRIEREAGSAYRVNGREVRARDVKILFEDAATGARSPALVRQGQIGEIVNAKPEQRRRILEDAAGVAGLHSRRHEAELRLKAAEGNLARLGDIIGQLTSQVESLKRQARQARRYKELSGEIRRADALLLHLLWTGAEADVQREEQALTVALTALAGAAQEEAEATVAEAAAGEPIGKLRENEAIRAAVLARVKISQETFEREAERQRQRQAELVERARQLTADHARENEQVAEAEERVAELVGLIGASEAAEAETDDIAAGLASAIGEGGRLVAAAEERLKGATAAVYEARARRRTAETALAERRGALERLKRRQSEVAAQIAAIAGRAPEAHKVSEAQAEGRELAAALAEIEDAIELAMAAGGEAAAQLRERQGEAEQAVLALRALETERATLTKVLLPATGGGEGIVDTISVSPGYETALGAALGDDLDASLSEDEPVHWREVDPQEADGALPDEAEPLIAHVEAPKALARRLRQIGVVEAQTGARLQARVKPGQRLVSKAGDLWRWDGFVAAGDAPTAAAQRLAERNRLAGLREREAEARGAAETASAALAQAEAAVRAAGSAEAGLRQRGRETQTALHRVRERVSELERAARETDARLSAVRDSEAEIADALIDAVAAVETSETELADVPASAPLEAEAGDAEAVLQAARGELATLTAELAGHEREKKLRAERIAGMRSERQRLMMRIEGARRQIDALEARLAETRGELDDGADLPARIEADRVKLIGEVETAERERREAADAVAAAESALRGAMTRLRGAQQAVSTQREERARAEARLEAARQRRSEEARRIRETLDVAPDAVLALAELTAEAALPNVSDVERQLGRLKSDRDRLGGVNLAADEELQTLSAQQENLDRERADVEQAIAKLRGGIGQLNREAKKRLDEAFKTVDGHFQRLFGILFGGGEARLELIEGEDPLEGGLEIIAKPPGKKPATLSLLSGGEQTLTALSLIFAVFLTNPSPICVLDEVDAPLDDANVDRFCTMMERMAADTETRFLVITHHPMTMARMNRLFGVTMGEKGVSQLVSVDLAAAERFLEAS